MICKKYITTSAMIAAVYVVLTLLFAPVSYGPVQVRISEALTLLPFFLPEAVPGLFTGCLIANFLGGYGFWDVIVGSFATLLAAHISSKMPTVFFAALPPVFINMLCVGALLHFLINVPFWAACFYVAIGETLACCALGLPLMIALEKRGLIKKK